MAGKIRFATTDDALQILGIYAPFITDTAISFETEIPSLENFRKRIEAIQSQYPYIVYEIDGKIIGYAYASKHHERAAYCYSADISIYILPEYQRMGIGRTLYTCLFEILKKQGYYTIIAGITLPNEKSIGIHKAMGFEEVGIYHNVGYKFGIWRDVIYLQKALREYDPIPARIKRIDELPQEFYHDLFNRMNL
jgi:L-amino acid N-acyltransferase YncA